MVTFSPLGRRISYHQALKQIVMIHIILSLLAIMLRFETENKQAT